MSSVYARAGEETETQDIMFGEQRQKPARQRSEDMLV